ncbi:MAG: chitinase [Snowella sp.]|jgi:putative chitinase|nr:MAG: chitinase [Snowella sp.]
MKLENIIQQNLTQSIDSLKDDRELCLEIQTRLQTLGLLPSNGVDGIYGPQTKQAFEQFKQQTHEGEPDTIGAGSAKTLLELNTLPAGNNLISNNQAESIYGHSITDQQLADLNSCLNRFEINTHPRIRHFLSQTAHESGGLKFMTEIWGPTVEQQQYDPPHAKAKELGNIAVGDGFKYRGAGVIQLTGRSNYQAFANFIHDPDVMEGANYVSIKYPFTSAGFWWHNNNMNALCDRGANVEEITRRVNGGLNGLSDREAYYAKALKIFA